MGFLGFSGMLQDFSAPVGAAIAFIKARFVPSSRRGIPFGYDW
ncbi:hypothetical protein [Cardiobacterium hominis]|jgi:hypothetical protein|nr:hypothetical protein [Cardiobacterium hominis]